MLRKLRVMKTCVFKLKLKEQQREMVFWPIQYLAECNEGIQNKFLLVKNSYVAILRTSYSFSFLDEDGRAESLIGQRVVSKNAEQNEFKRGLWIQIANGKNSRWITHPGQFCLPSSGFHQVSNRKKSLVVGSLSGIFSPDRDDF